RGWRDFRIAKRVRRRRGAASVRGRASGLLLLRRWHREGRPVLPGLLRAHVVPSNEQGDGLGIVDRLNGEAGGGRMERTSGLRDLSEDRKAGNGSGVEARGPFRKI